MSNMSDSRSECAKEAAPQFRPGDRVTHRKTYGKGVVLSIDSETKVVVQWDEGKRAARPVQKQYLKHEKTGNFLNKRHCSLTSQQKEALARVIPTSRKWDEGDHIASNAFLSEHGLALTQLNHEDNKWQTVNSEPKPVTNK